jgi:type IV pilus assembly protein PilX
MKTVSFRRQQQGVVLIGALFALVLLMLAATAMLRSSDISAMLAGNLSFQRDLTNQAERGFAAARQLMGSGALAAESARESNLATSNYFAARLTTNASGIPKVLTSEKAYEDAKFSVADISENGVTVRFVIDRQCLAEGAFSAANCETFAGSSDASGSSWLRKPGSERRPLYRVSVRVTGPRNTQAFFQSTFAL